MDISFFCCMFCVLVCSTEGIAGETYKRLQKATKHTFCMLVDSHFQYFKDSSYLATSKKMVTSSLGNNLIRHEPSRKASGFNSFKTKKRQLQKKSQLQREKSAKIEIKKSSSNMHAAVHWPFVFQCIWLSRPWTYFHYSSEKNDDMSKLLKQSHNSSSFAKDFIQVFLSATLDITRGLLQCWAVAR